MTGSNGIERISAARVIRARWRSRREAQQRGRRMALLQRARVRVDMLRALAYA